jgi:hypothetical protein
VPVWVSQETLLPLDPDKVQVPVIVGRRELAEHDRAGVEQIEHLLCAAHDHPANLHQSVARSCGKLVFVDHTPEQITTRHPYRELGPRDWP